MKAIVIGGAGFIGSHLVEQLLEKGISVKVYDNLTSGSSGNLRSIASEIELIQDDIRHFDGLVKAMKGVDWVFHLAALTSVAQSVDNPLLAHEINNTGTLNVLWAAVQSKVSRVIISSSCAVYGDSHTPPVRETDLPVPKSPYAASKLTAEAFASSFYAAYGLPSLCLRYFNVYGERQRPDSDYAAVIPRFIEAYRTHQTPHIYGDGYQSRDFIHVRDVAKANFLAAAVEASVLSHYRVFNIGTGVSTNLRELLDIIAESVGYEIPPQFHSARTGDIQHSCSDITLATKKLGFSPTIDLKSGLKNLVRSSLFKPSTNAIKRS